MKNHILPIFLLIISSSNNVYGFDWLRIKNVARALTATPTLTPTPTPTPAPTPTPTISISTEPPISFTTTTITTTITPSIGASSTTQTFITIITSTFSVSIPTITPTSTITPTPTITSAPGCTLTLPSSTLTCVNNSCHTICADDQQYLQIGHKYNETHSCGEFKCQECPIPICDPQCDCDEECIIESKESQVEAGRLCPIASCKPIPTCLTCPEVHCNLDCMENYECKIKPAVNCYSCPVAVCEPKPCLECPTEPTTCLCPRGKECKVFQNACYKCGHVECVDIPDPCEGCKGECSVSPHPNCENCPPQRLCVEKCRECSPFLPDWTCSNPMDAIYDYKTCSTCPQYHCKADCKECDESAVPKCECENQKDCILQPRSCDQCATYYCKNECVADGPGEACPCDDVSLCVYRKGNCFTNSYYECVPPGKGTMENLDLKAGREAAMLRKYK